MSDGHSKPCGGLGPQFVGDPVDTVTGEVRDVTTDFRLWPLSAREVTPGTVVRDTRVFAFERSYHAFRARSEDRGLGRGHRHSLDWAVRVDVDGLTVHTPDDPLEFPHLWENGAAITRSGWTLSRTSDQEFVLRRSGEPTRVFERSGGRARDARLTRIVHGAGPGAVAGETRLTYESGRVANQQTMRLSSASDTQGWHLRFVWGTSPNDAGHLRAVYADGPGLSEHQDKPLISYDYEAAPAGSGYAFLTRGTDAYGHHFDWSYDADGKVVRRADRRGYAFVYLYDRQGRCIRAAGEDDVDAVRLSYDPAAHETTVVNEATGARSLYRYDPTLNLLDITGPEGAVQSLLYDERGELVAESDPLGEMWTMVRDASGAIVGKRDPLGYVHDFLADVTRPDFDPLAIALPAGAMAQEHGAAQAHDFDVPREGSLARELPESLRSALLPGEYAGRLVEVRNAQGLLLRKDRCYGDGTVRSRRYGYDPNGNLRHFRDADGGDWHEEYASWNQRTLQTDPLGHTTRFAYSKRDRMVRVEDALGTTTEYGWDLRDRLSEVRRHGKVRERYVYDAAGGLVEKRVPRVVPPSDAAAPTVESATDSGDVLLVSYKRGPLRTLLGRKTNAEVDGFGVAETFTRDARGRIVGAKYADATGSAGEQTQAHDGAGRRLLDARKDAGGTSSVAHRYLGDRLLSTTVQLVEDGPVYRVKYHRPLSAVSPAGPNGAARSASTVTLVIDPTDQMHRLQRVDAGVLRRDFASGTTEVAQYDSEGRCLAKASEGASGLRRRRFLRSAEGDLLERQDEARGTTRYRYDKAHRLTGVQSPDGAVHEYAHDEAGNLLRKPGLSEGYVAGVQAGPAAVAFDTSHVALSRGNKLYRANGDRFHYDARDHVVAREGSWGRLSYVRDGLGRLRRIDWTAPDGSHTSTTWEADYDTLGRRVRKVVHRVAADGTPVFDEWRFVWDGDRLVAEVMPEVIDAEGKPQRPVRLYVYSDAVALVPMLAMDYASLDAPPETGRVYALFTDHRGAVERVEDMAGAIVWDADIGPYGEAVVGVGASTSDAPFHQPFRLVGQYYDEETQLCAHRYRSYSPELGRFLESDPIGLQGGLNVYAWPGCPLVASDPLGLDCGKGDPPDVPPPPPPPRRREDAADSESTAGSTARPHTGPPPDDSSVRARWAPEWGVDPVTGRSTGRGVGDLSPADIDARARRPAAEDSGLAPHEREVVSRRRRYLEECPNGMYRRPEDIGAWQESGFRANVNRDSSSPHEAAAVTARGGTLNNASAAAGGQQTHTHREWVDENGRAMGPVARNADGTFDESNPPPGTRGSRETTTRPDGVRGNDIIEHKHMTGSSDVYNDDQQLRAQREMAGTRGGRHELVLTSTRPLEGDPPRPAVRPSSGAADGTRVLYHDPATGRTFEWDPRRNRWK